MQALNLAAKVCLGLSMAVDYSLFGLHGKFHIDFFLLQAFDLLLKKLNLHLYTLFV